MFLDSAPDEIILNTSAFIGNPAEYLRFKDSCKRLDSLLPEIFTFSCPDAIYRFNKDFRITSPPSRLKLTIAGQIDREAVIEIMKKCQKTLTVSCLRFVGFNVFCDLLVYKPRKLAHLIITAIEIDDIQILDISCVLIRNLLDNFILTETYVPKIASIFARKGSVPQLCRFTMIMKQTLHEASVYEIVEALISSGGGYEIPSLWKDGLEYNINSYYGSYLHIAIRSCSQQLVEHALSNKRKVRERYRHGVEPIIMAACYSGDPKILQCVLDAGFDPKMRDFHGNTALMILRQTIKRSRMGSKHQSGCEKFLRLQEMEAMLSAHVE